MRRILILNPGDGTGINFTRSLAEDGSKWATIGLSPDLGDYHSSETGVRLLRHWSSEEELVAAINDVVVEHAVDLVYAADTGRELMATSRHRSSIGAPLMLPDIADHLRMEDKWETYKSIRDADLPAPDTIELTAPEDLAALFSRHTRVWLRRKTGSVAAGAIATSNAVFARAWVDEQNGWGDFMAAECLTGETATFSGVWYDGELIASQLRARIGWKHSYMAASGVTGITGAQTTIWDAALHSLALDCIRAAALRPHGAIGVDFTRSADGRWLPTEVQPARFYTSIYFLTRCGLNLAAMYCRLALDGRGAVGEPLINPIRNAKYWVKGVDQLPQLLSPEDYLVAP